MKELEVTSFAVLKIASVKIQLPSLPSTFRQLLTFYQGEDSPAMRLVTNWLICNEFIVWFS